MAMLRLGSVVMIPAAAGMAEVDDNAICHEDNDHPRAR